MTTLRTIALVGALSLAAVACGGEGDTTPPAAGTTPPATESPAAGAQMVEAGDNFFRPEEVRVSVGEMVQWENRGNNPHTVTADDGSFDSSPDCPADTSACMQPGSTYEQTFSSPGRIPYYCKLHGAPGGRGMSGVIFVEA